MQNRVPLEVLWCRSLLELFDLLVFFCLWGTDLEEAL